LGPKENNVKVSTVRFTQADLQVLQKLESLTGLKRAQVIRVALRNLLRRVEK
jgi:hypothetical protein